MWEDGDNDYWNEAKPDQWYTGDAMTSGSTGSMKCPECGSYNTMQTVYVDKCNSCGWSQGY